MKNFFLYIKNMILQKQCDSMIGDRKRGFACCIKHKYHYGSHITYNGKKFYD